MGTTRVGEPATWEGINRVLLQSVDGLAVEDATSVRVDCTVVDANIHEPSDSSLLWDTVRVLSRLMTRARDAGAQFEFHDHSRRAKRRDVGVLNAKGKVERRRVPSSSQPGITIVPHITKNRLHKTFTFALGSRTRKAPMTPEMAPEAPIIGTYVHGCAAQRTG